MAEPRNPWWKRKRWIAAAALWLAMPVSYPLSLGPAAYACGRGWISRESVTDFYGPLRYATRLTGLRLQEDTYGMLWYRKGLQHAKASEAPQANSVESLSK